MHLSEKLLLDEHVSALCTMLRGASPYTTQAGTVSTQAVGAVSTLLTGKAPVVGTRRIFLERNNIGDAGAASSVEDVWRSVWHLRPAAALRRLLSAVAHASG